MTSDWIIENSGKDGVVTVPSDAITWDVQSQSWKSVGSDVTATSKVTFDLKLGDWHHSEKMDMNDILYSTYFLFEWGSTQTGSARMSWQCDFFCGAPWRIGFNRDFGSNGSNRL